MTTITTTSVTAAAESVLRHVDLAFVVDTTGSMGSFITAARQQMIAMITGLTGAASTPIDLRLGIVEYRDHPPQDSSFVARPHAFSADLTGVQRTINGLTPAGGGDAPEAVFDGLTSAAGGLAWRPHSRRLAVLIGDAPPHGVGSPGDGFAAGCPCGLTLPATTGILEAAGITLYAIGLTGSVKDSFAKLAAFTGGSSFEPGRGDRAIDTLQGVLAAEFAGIDFDRRVLERWHELASAGDGRSVDRLGDDLTAGRGQIAASLNRLGRRGLLARLTHESPAAVGAPAGR